MMKTCTTTALLFSAIGSTVVVTAENCPTNWACPPVDGSAPVLDGDVTDWASVPAFTTSLVANDGSTEYMDGELAKLKCQHDSTHIFLSLEIPGIYSFNATDNHFCAAIGTMMKIGVDATFINMGGCPDAMQGCAADGTVPASCDTHRVDIGAHWELATTEMGKMYGGNQTVGSGGNDLVANNDDEYGVSPWCRKDDDDTNAANEWSGAWSHTDPTKDTMGTYIFELSRLLQTPSTVSDAQMTSGNTYEFGIAFWDPTETAEGWSDAGHYLSGCGKNWVELSLAAAKPDSTSGANNILVTGATMVGLSFFMVFVASF